ncbi:MAG: DsbA family protein [Alphaproteobacteria bacterium]|nr:DsbA family protein [Alphaproteobacteria bacterium]
MRILFIMLAVIMAAFVGAAKAEAAEPSQKQINTYIHDYLMQNPEVLKAAIDNVYDHLEAQKKKSVKNILQDKYAEIYRNPRDFTLGRDNAPITIVEFFDYNCGYCKRSFKKLMRVVRENDDVRLVFKEFPVLGKASRQAAEAALTLPNPQDFLTYHTRLMSNKNRLNEGEIRAALQAVQAKPEAAFTKGKRRDIQDHITATHNLGRALNIDGTPSFIINNKIYKGALDYDELVAAIDEARNNL